MSELPSKKRTPGELDELRRRNAFTEKPSMQHIMAQELNLFLTTLLYIIAVVSVVLLLMQIYLPAIYCAGVSLLMALIVFWKKPISSHHASIVTIISLLVLTFGSVYYLEEFKPKADEEQKRSTRY